MDVRRVGGDRAVVVLAASHQPVLDAELVDGLAPVDRRELPGQESLQRELGQLARAHDQPVEGGSVALVQDVRRRHERVRQDHPHLGLRRVASREHAD